ncbi:ANTAR domain-containing protein [Pseudonocardia hispaniensis]|uniref:ANTAR domain-containing protein n=1 Tax=Pseudonocardia hispaniensis TaxID=904933 RepID=A0ABW1J6M7_9PSEU
MPKTPAPDPESELGNIGLDLLRLLLVANDIEEYLTGAARIAVDVTPAISSGITVRMTPDSPTWVGYSDEIAQRLAAIQHALGDGPLLACLRNAAPVEIPKTDADSRWPKFNDLCRAEGVCAVLSMPLVIGMRPIGVITLYAPAPHTFADARRGPRLADPIALGAALAGRLAERTNRIRHLEIALTSRATVDQALGILMARYHITAEEAFQLLRRRSQHTNVKLREVAAALIAAVSHVRSRPRPPDG